MKFGSYLREHQLNEWRRAYINYRQLKKAIGRAESELEEIDGQKTEADINRERDIEQGRGAGREETEEPTSPGGQSSSRERTKADGRNAPPQRHDSAVSMKSNSSAGLIRRRQQPSRKISLTPANEVNPRHWRTPFNPDMTLDELREKVPTASGRFLTLVDNEIDKIDKFYCDREKEYQARYEELSRQWKELVEHQKDYQAFRQRSSAFGQAARRAPGGQLVRRALGQGGGQHAHDEYPEMDHGRPEEYMTARSKLKLATFEFYRGLGMLKNYRVLNRTGLAKALKKFEKATHIPCANAFATKIDNSNFVKSEQLDQLIRDTEDAFTRVFEHGDRKKALERLRDFGGRQTHHFTAWRTGVFIGLGIPLLIEGIIKSTEASTHQTILYWQPLLQLWGAFFVPVLFAMLFSINIFGWEAARINRILVFELDVRTRLDSRQYLELPAVIFFLFSFLFAASFYNLVPTAISPESYAMTFLVACMILLLMPVSWFYGSARWWMVRSFSRVITAGLVRVEFRDFFLGDELNSLYWSMTNFALLYCAFSKNWPANTGQVCSTNDMWATPVLASLPALWRLGQSLRRYLDSDGLGIHLLNAGKYSCSVVQFFLYYSWRMHGSTPGARKIVWIISAIVNSSYTSTWDIMLDWSLLHRGSKHFLLRNELGFFKTKPWVYYIAIVSDIILRFAWVINLPTGGPPASLRGFVAAILEAVRRIVWNSFRVESEHIGNVDGYRVTRNVPLPYTSLPAPRDDTDDDSAEPRSLKTRVASTLQSLQMGLAHDFAPLANIHLLVLGRKMEAREATKRRKKERKSRKAGEEADSSEGEDGEEAEGDGEGERQHDDADDDEFDMDMDLSPTENERTHSGGDGDGSEHEQALAELAQARRMMHEGDDEDKKDV